MPHNLSAHANMPIPKPSLHPREETHHPFPMPCLFPPMPPVHMFLHRFRLSVRDLFFRSDRYTEDLQSQADKTDCRSALHALPDSPGQFRFLQIRFLIYRYINRISIFHRSHPRILSQKFRNLRIIPCGIFWHQKYYHDNNCSSRNTTANRHNLSDHPVSARFFFPGGCRYSIYILTAYCLDA